MNYTKAILVVLFLSFYGFLFSGMNVHASSSSLYIMVDPGHGGSDGGAVALDGTQEKDINLLLAQMLRDELDNYENVTVGLTRDGDYAVELSERTEIALSAGADVLISIHNNAIGEDPPYVSGSTVLVSQKQYKENLGQQEQELGVCILKELSKVGLEDQGLLLRDSQNQTKYPNGALADYYAIIRQGIENDICSILIEHAFVDNQNDYNNYLSSKEKLRTLAAADARGIAAFYELYSTSVLSSPKKPLNCTEKLVHMVDDITAHNIISYEDYFVTKKSENTYTDSQVEKQIVSRKDKNSNGYSNRSRVNKTKKRKSKIDHRMIMLVFGALIILFIIFAIKRINFYLVSFVTWRKISDKWLIVLPTIRRRK